MKEVWSGIDVSKDYFDVSWVPADTRTEDLRKIPHHQFERNAAGVRKYLRWLDEQGSESPVRVLMEATGRYSLELHALLVAQRPELAPAIVNPKRAKHHHQSLSLRNKTDEVDARSLGLMGKERQPRPYQPPEAHFAELRELMRQRRDLLDVRVAEHQRLLEIKKNSTTGRILTSHIKHLDKLLVRIDSAAKKILYSHPSLREDWSLLQTIPGVGPVVAFTVLAELGDLRRYERSRELSAATGLSPVINRSGKSQKRTRISREGPSEVRAKLYMAALSAVFSSRHNHLTDIFTHLVEDQGKTKKEALVAVGRKIPIIMRAMLIHQRPYIDDLSAVTL